MKIIPVEVLASLLEIAQEKITSVELTRAEDSQTGITGEFKKVDGTTIPQMDVYDNVLSIYAGFMTPQFKIIRVVEEIPHVTGTFKILNAVCEGTTIRIVFKK